MSDLAMKVLEWQSKGGIGVSSATMASIALGMKKNFYHSHFSAPSDPADLMRCMNLVDEIPEIRNHFTTIGKRVSAFKPILDNWDELIAILKSEISRADRRAPKTYMRMKELLRE